MARHKSSWNRLEDEITTMLLSICQYMGIINFISFPINRPANYASWILCPNAPWHGFLLMYEKMNPISPVNGFAVDRITGCWEKLLNFE